MKCMDCPYFWMDEDEDRAYCHYHWEDGYAPCEVDDTEAETEDNDEEEMED